MPVTAVLDACVLYPAPLRDLLLHVALTDVFRARWSDAIHDEWTRSLLARRPDLTAEQLARTRRLMDRAVPDAVVAGYEPLIGRLALPDPDDRHVLAAAVHGRADCIVTFNLSDFPASALAPYGVEAVHPDRFVLRLLERDAAAVVAAARRQRRALKNPPRTPREFLGVLAGQGLTETAARLGTRAGEL